jgi:hypothetical protein
MAVGRTRAAGGEIELADLSPVGRTRFEEDFSHETSSCQIGLAVLAGSIE